MPRALALVVPLLFLVSCATLSEDQCRNADWHALGVNDGAKGRDASFVENHAEACAKYGIAPDEAAWLAGLQEGQRLYCTPVNAYETGREGLALRPVCTSSELQAMQAPYARGAHYYNISRRMDEIEDRMRAIRAEIAGLAPGDSRIVTLNSELLWLGARYRMLAAERLAYSHYP